jgi:hypothetical protein
MDELVIESSMAMKLQMGRGKAIMSNRPWRLPILQVTLPAGHKRTMGNAETIP